MTRPVRARRAPRRYSPAPSKLDDDYASEEYDSDATLDGSDVTSVATTEASEEVDGDLPGFVVSDASEVESVASNSLTESESEYSDSESEGSSGYAGSESDCGDSDTDSDSESVSSQPVTLKPEHNV